MLVLLEHLNPKERAVFILKQVFDYPHQEIAEIFSISIENSRQLLSRAKSILKVQVFDFYLRSGPATDFLSEYADIIRNGEVKKLEDILSKHITAQSDGGGKIKVLSEFTSGINAVASLTVRVFELYLWKCMKAFKSLNHFPALLFYTGDKLVNCQIIAMNQATRIIDKIFNVVDPQN